MPDVTKEYNIYAETQTGMTLAIRSKDAVDSAIAPPEDFTNLSRSIGDVINDTIDTVKGFCKNCRTAEPKTIQCQPILQNSTHTHRHRSSPSRRHCTTNVPAGRQVPSSAWHLAIPWEFSHWPDVITFTALSAAVSHMFLVPACHFRCACSRQVFTLGTRWHQKDSPAEPLSEAMYARLITASASHSKQLADRAS